MRYLKLTVLFAAFLLLTPFSAQAAEKTLTVVELFTSQGCSSCPPADSYVGELAKRDDVLALSFHVDYWDYIGWKDPFANPQHTVRQRRYSRQMNLSYVYTPQVVIQGSEQAVGSNIADINKKIAKTQRNDSVPVTIKQKSGGDVQISVEAFKDQGSAEIYLIGFDNSHSTDIRRGENSGRKLYNYNVVRGMRRIGTWSGKAVTIPASVLNLAKNKPDNCAVIVQSKRTGKIIGAAKISLTKSGT
ncbi:MAG: DUF1223 domain-containing protein [Rhodospirillales bacterium]|nr:DUF1223 domain-containing protein [Rhodospirillales bacterium]